MPREKKTVDEAHELRLMAALIVCNRLESCTVTFLFIGVSNILDGTPININSVSNAKNNGFRSNLLRYLTTSWEEWFKIDSRGIKKKKTVSLTPSGKVKLKEMLKPEPVNSAWSSAREYVRQSAESFEMT